MTLPQSIPVVAGALAIFSTSALIAVYAILAHQLDSTTASTTLVIAIVSAIVEGTVLLVLCANLAYYLRKRTRGRDANSYVNEKRVSKPVQKPSGLWFGLSILFCTAAAAVSIAALVCLGSSASNLPSTILGSGAVPFLAGASVTLGVCYTAQLLFLITQLIAVRVPSMNGTAELPSAEDAYRRDVSASQSPNNGTRTSPAARVKAIRYSQTLDPVPTGSRRGRMATLTGDVRSPPGSSGGRSATETLSSLRSSLSNAVRPISSKTRLLATSSTGSLPSLRGSASFVNSSPTTSTYIARNRDRDPSTGIEDDFDSWDTSAVSPQNRRAVLESSVSPIPGASRFLETIPASPTISRCPSPGAPLDLVGPSQTRRRSRSYSSLPRSSSPSSQSMASVAAAATRARSQSLSPPNEAHIHPLFRSDSPTPPPAVSAGTVVTAAPNAGQMLAADVQCLRTLNRMRSGSLPVVPSPLSRQGSFDDFAVRRALAGSPSALGSSSVLSSSNGGGVVELGRLLTSGRLPSAGPEEEDEEEAEADYIDSAEREKQTQLGERKMTPPIPEWILSAGTRTSLSGYQSRKVRIEDGAI